MNSKDNKTSLSDGDMVTKPQKNAQNPENASRELSKNNPADFKNADGNDPRKADGRDPYKGSAQDKDKPEDVTNTGDAVW